MKMTKHIRDRSRFCEQVSEIFQLVPQLTPEQLARTPWFEMHPKMTAFQACVVQRRDVEGPSFSGKHVATVKLETTASTSMPGKQIAFLVMFDGFGKEVLCTPRQITHETLLEVERGILGTPVVVDEDMAGISKMCDVATARLEAMLVVMRECAKKNAKQIPSWDRLDAIMAQSLGSSW